MKRTRKSLVRHMLVSTVLMFAIGSAWAVLSESSNAQAPPTAASAALPDADDSEAVAAYCDGKIPPENKFEHAKLTELPLSGWLERFAPLLILFVVIFIVIVRLPKLDLGHSKAYRRRRIMNWLPLGLTYAFLYMGRYNLNVAKTSLSGEMGFDLPEFMFIFGIGTAVYAVSFLINGPLTDRIGGKKAILIGAAGSALANLGMGLLVLGGPSDNFISLMALLYGVNMYFQSFGAVSIVKVNAPWFHVRERGVFGAIFGILISLGIYFAYDWSQLLVELFPHAKEVVFLAPALLLAVFGTLVFIMVKNTPGEAGHKDFLTGDASDGDDGPRLPVAVVFKKMLTNPVIMTIACIEFCSGYLRQGIMQVYKPYAKAIENPDPMIGWVYENWGLLLCCAGILGGVFAGIISDHVFQSRRGPVAAVLYGLMLILSLIGIFLVATPIIGFMVVFMSMAVIGVHGMLSGTASMDFGGKRNVGVAVGIIDGFVYLGSATMSLVFGLILPSGDPILPDCTRANMDPDAWIVWPIGMVPLALIGFLLSRRIWNAKPQPKAAGGH